MTSGTLNARSLRTGEINSLNTTLLLARPLLPSTMSEVDLQRKAASATNSTFLTALVFNAFVFGVELAVFTLIRPYFRTIYEPRASVKKRIQTLTNSTFLWPWAVWNADYRAIAPANGMDAYFFVRFLRMMVKVFFPIWIISWAVLLPTTSVNTHVEPNRGLNLFIFGNVATNDQERYAAHLILIWLFTGWIFYNIKVEMSHFTITRQRHLIHPSHANTVQATTVLVTGIPAKYLSEGAITKVFAHLPGGVKRVWINRNLKDLPDIFDRQLAACSKLESAETTLVRTAVKMQAQAEKAKQSKGKQGQTDVESGSAGKQQSGDTSIPVVPKDKRPSHRLGTIPFTGEKVDTIEWARQEIRVCQALLDKGRQNVSGMGSDGNKEGGADANKKDYPLLNSAFVTFNQQIAAHMAGQVLTHHEPYRMAEKYVEVSPEDVIWSNLSLNPYEQKVRMLIGYAATSALILFWAVPVAFVGIISNIGQLCAKYSWLSWLCKIPKPIYGIIAGILPPVLLAILVMLLPIILRLLAQFQGIPKRSGVELALMNRFFTFQVIHSFLIVTVSSGLISAVQDLSNNPSSIPTTLAQKLPQASIFFLTYVILQGLSGTAGGFLQIVPLVVYYVKLFILGSTPRSVYGIKFGLRSVTWGTLFPNITLLVVITLGYSIIAPIINGLACATFFAFYMLYKFLFLWQLQQPLSTDTGGLFFPKAIQHLFVGMYVQQVCLAALFFLSQDENKKPSATPEGALMVVLIIATILFQIMIQKQYGPLTEYLPLTLADKTGATPSMEDADAFPTHAMPADAPGCTSSADPSAEEGGRPSIVKGHDEYTSPENGHDGSEKARAVDEAERHGFEHPAMWKRQRVVWIPRDELGLGVEEAEACRAVGVGASVRGAVMDEKGKVDVDGMPPEERGI